VTPGQRLARLVTEAVVRVPAAWPLLRPLVRRLFDRLAPVWDQLGSPERLVAFEAALDEVTVTPRRVLDLGTGTGSAAFSMAQRWPEAELVGVDLAEGMVAVARRQTPPELAPRLRFERADAAHLPYAPGSFDLVALSNMIPFPAELARVLAPGGHLVVAFTHGAGTPIYVPAARLRRALERHGFTHVADVAAGPGTALVARRQETGGRRSAQGRACSS
jgi:ubiquinone/menaquinone biosynthesis C-methylase UbiE